MASKQAQEILGLEYDWLVSDADGHVAIFSTAGGGHAPEEFLRDTDRHDAAIDEILALPASTTARFAPDSDPEDSSTWRLAAERGLFAFDSDYHGGPYRRVAAPVRPIHMSELPGHAAEVVRSLRLPRVRFAESALVSRETIAEQTA